VNEKYNTCEGYHAVPPPYIGNFIPSKPDLVFADEHVVSDSVTSLTDITKSKVKTNETKLKNVSAPIIKDWVSDSKDEDVIELESKQIKPSFAKVKFVKYSKHVKSPRKSIKQEESNRQPNTLGKPVKVLEIVSPSFEKKFCSKSSLNYSGLKTLNIARHPSSRASVSVNTSRPINTSYPRLTVNGTKPSSNVFHKSHSSFRRTFNQRTAPKNSDLKEKVNIVKVNNVTTAGTKAVVSAVQGNGENVVKSSACWIGRPIGNVINHVSKDSGSYMLKRFNYVDLQGRLKTRKLDFEDVYFVKELKFNLFSVLQMCDKQNSVLFTKTECLVLSPNFKLHDENQVLLKVPRQNNMYIFDLKNVVYSGGLTCLFAKAIIDESNLWHRRLGHINFKTMNKLVRETLVRGLPSKIFENDHTCVACRKGKQHKAICKTKFVSSISQPLQILHMDLFGLTFVKSLNNKMYCLVTTDDFSRFSWVFFLVSKDETGEILKLFITGIENQLNIGLKLSDNRVLVTKPHNKTPYELLIGRSPNINFMTPFGCPVTILNILDHLGKFEGKADEGFLVGYFVNNKAFRVFNSRTRKVKENLHIKFIENKSNVVGRGPTWLFDIDSLTNSMNYEPVTVRNQTNDDAGIEIHVNTGQAGQEKESDHEYILLPFMPSNSPLSSSTKSSNDKDVDEVPGKGDEGVWILVDLPNGKKAIGTKWVFRNKKDERGIVVRNKARLVMDVKSAFLYVTIEKEVYVCQPPGFEDPHFPNKVYKVEKALYDLHQALRAWYETLSTYLLENRFRRGTIDKTLFILKDRVSTPMEPNKALIKDAEAEDVDVHLYRSMIGSLMYLTASRPDIMFVVYACAKFQVTPKTLHLHAVKRIFRYLKGQPKLGLWYPKDSVFDLKAFFDSDYAGASRGRKSTTEGCQFLGKRLISWKCKKKTIVANSTTEAEYVAAANYCGQVLWIQTQMLDYGFNFMNTKIYIDNESTICIVKNLVFHSKTKHIEIRHHFIRDSYEKKLIQVIKIHIDHNVADLLTKAFDVSRFNFLIVGIGIRALIDGKKIIVNEASIRRDLKLEDAEGTACLPNDTIFEELARMGKETEVSQEEPPTEEHIPAPSNDPLPSGEDRFQLNELMEICTKFSDRVLSLEQNKTNQAAENKKLKKRVKKLEGKKKKRTHGLKRMYKVGLSARIVSFDEEGLDDQEDASKQGRIAKIDDDEDLSLINKIAQDQGRMNEEDLFGVHDLDSDGVIAGVTAGENVEQDAQLLKRREREIIVQEPNEFRTTSSSQPSQLPQAKDKGKGIMIELEKPLEKKDQIALDEEVARKQLAEQIQAQEREQLSIEERSKLLVELIESRRKYFAAKRAEEIRNKPPIKMFKNFNREDLEVLRSIVKERFKKTKPVDDMDNLIFQTLRTMFEHHIEDNIWKDQQGAVKLHNWKLFDSHGVYCVTTQNMVYYLLVKKMYLFTNNILHQLWKDVRLQVDYEVEMAYDLLRLIRRQINEGYIPA
nr:hypothetical protein [Tanacetum cinerariifolium]